jgi:two-component system chemotaxis response regulator CheY
MVTQAIDGIDALEQIGRTFFRAVVLDVNMPRLNGLDMLERLMSDPQHDAGLPFLMLTTEVQPSMIQRAKKAGARAWMVKPIKLEQLVSAVSKLAR